MTSTKDSQELPAGQRLLSRYTIIDKVASGGMATIYRANDDRLDRVVCVKLLRTVLTGTGSTSGGAVYQATYDHFLKEALALSKLQHPNTLKIYDFGFLEPDRPFQISEYLEGGNLEGHVRHRGALGSAEIVGILERMTSAAAEAHQHNIIHRDIKPSNILFARVGDALMPKLADFGIAHSDVTRTTPALEGDDDENTQSLSTVTLFSPRWAAPEQLCGAPEGPYTDVYAFALVTAYMLRAKIAFSDGNVRATFPDRVQSDEFVAERLVWLGFEGELRDVLFDALRSNSAHRTQSAPEFYEAVKRVLRGSMVVSAISPNRVAAEEAPTLVPAHEALQQSGIPVEAADPLTQRREAPQIPPHLQHPPHLQQVQQVQQPPPPPQHPGQYLPQMESLRVEVPDSAQQVQEQIAPLGARNVRYITVHEKLDLSFLDVHGGEVRFRVSILPAVDSINVKGLNCFVQRPGGRPSPALTATADGSADLVSARRETLGSLSWSFGVPGPTGRVFLVDGAQLVVPYGEAAQAVALLPSRGRDLVVMLRR